MNAVILAAGMGRRFQPEPLAYPKCLLEIGGKSLLERSIENLSWLGVDGVTVVAGYRAELIERAVERLATELPISVRYNPNYEGGSAGSVLCAADVFETQTTLMLDADVLYDRRILERMLACKDENAILVDCGIQTTALEYWLTGDRLRLTGTYKGIRNEAAIGVYWGLHKFSADAGKAYVRLARPAVGADAGTEYWYVVPRLLEEAVFGYVDLDGLIFFEIDTLHEMEWARSHIYPQLAALGQS